MGLDEISCAGPANILEINGHEKHQYKIDCTEFGLPRCSKEDLRGGHAKQNAELLLNTFRGKRGPIANTLIMNAAVALYLYGLHSSIAEAVTHASDTLYSGAVLTLLNNWIEFSHE
jgi:anthranilate phosphoribosyltransferase